MLNDVLDLTNQFSENKITEQLDNIKVTPDINAFYINLDDNKDRRTNIENILISLKFSNFKRINACDTRTIENVNKYIKLIDTDAYNTLINNIKTGKRNMHRELTKGAIGCYLSHIMIYDYMIKNNIPFALIFEDDCGISESHDNFWKKINSIDIPSDADIFLFDAVFHEYNLNNCPTNNVCQVYFFYGTHFYLITLSGAQKVLKYLLPIKYQIDNSMSILSYAQKIKIYGSRNIKFNIKNNFGSTIQLLKCPTCDTFKEINFIKKKIKAINQNQYSNLFYYIEHFSHTNNQISTYILSILLLIIILIIFNYYDYFFY